MSINELYRLYLERPVISTDTRKISEGCIFFALKGEKFDANTFAAQAIEAGAAYAVIDDANYRANDQCILVDDVLVTLQDLARYHRQQLSIPVVGLTGTNGKTTTKELINAVLSQHFKTYATQGNLNNHIGVPLSILSIGPSHEMAVIEMGANHQKEIEFLCSISQPTHGLITNVGKAHLEGFGGVEGVKKAKGELYDFLKVTNGTTFVNSNSEALMAMQRARHLNEVVFYGDDTTALVSGQMLDNSPYLELQWKNNKTLESHKIKTQLTGAYNLDNILAAICIGCWFNLSADEINRGVEGYQPKNNRSQLVTTATNTLICDYYNANPSSMAVAIENLDKLKADKKVIILGDMFEMGDEAEAEHRSILEKALAANFNQRIFIGEEFYKLQGANATFYRTAEDAFSALQTAPITHATVLIKGSRGMALERLVSLF